MDLKNFYEKIKDYIDDMEIFITISKKLKTLNLQNISDLLLPKLNKNTKILKIYFRYFTVNSQFFNYEENNSYNSYLSQNYLNNKILCFDIQYIDNNIFTITNNFGNKNDKNEKMNSC